MKKLLKIFLQYTKHCKKIATSALYVYCSLKTVQEQAQSTRSIKLTCHRQLKKLKFFKFRTSGRINRVKFIIRDSIVWDFKMWPLAILTGDHVNGVFFIRKCIAREKSGNNNEVTVLLR